MSEPIKKRTITSARLSRGKCSFTNMAPTVIPNHSSTAFIQYCHLATERFVPETRSFILAMVEKRWFVIRMPFDKRGPYHLIQKKFVQKANKRYAWMLLRRTSIFRKSVRRTYFINSASFLFLHFLTLNVSVFVILIFEMSNEAQTDT